MSTKPRKKIVIVPERVDERAGGRLRTLQRSNTTRRPFTFQLPKLKPNDSDEQAKLNSSKKDRRSVSFTGSGTKTSKNLRTAQATEAAIEDQDAALQELHFSGQDVAHKTLEDTGNKSRDSVKRSSTSAISKSAAKSPRKTIVIVPHGVRANTLRLQTLRKRTTTRPFVFDLSRQKTRKPAPSPQQSVVPEHEIQTPPEPESGAVASPRSPRMDVPKPQATVISTEGDDWYEIVDDAEYKINPLQLELKKINLARRLAAIKEGKVSSGLSKESRVKKLLMWKGRDRCREIKDPCDLDVVLDMIISVMNKFKNNAEDEFEVELCDTYRANLQQLITDDLDKMIQMQKINNQIRKVRRQLTARNTFRIAMERKNFGLQAELETKLRERNLRATTTNAAD